MSITDSDKLHTHHNPVSRETDTILGRGTIPEPSAPRVDKGVALVAQTASFVYIYARIPQITEMTLSFYVTLGVICSQETLPRSAPFPGTIS